MACPVSPLSSLPSLPQVQSRANTRTPSSSGLEFTSLALRKNVDSSEELTASFTSSYTETLKKHHNMLVKGIFGMAMKACPYRADFYKKLGDDEAVVSSKLREWLGALENIVGILNGFLAEKNIK